MKKPDFRKKLINLKKRRRNNGPSDRRPKILIGKFCWEALMHRSYKKMALSLFQECLDLTILYNDWDIYNKLQDDYPVLVKDYDRMVTKRLKNVKLPEHLKNPDMNREFIEKLHRAIRKRYGSDNGLQ